MNYISEKRRTVMVIVLGVLTGATFILTGRFNSMVNEMGADAALFGLTAIPASSMKGILVAITSLLCFIMVTVDYKRGRILAIIAQTASMAGMISNVVKKDYSVVPGMCNVVMSVISILIIARQFGILERVSITDEVTGLFNHQGFVIEANKMKEKGKLGYIVFIQLKDFRNINEKLGHDYGNMALKIVAQRIKEVSGEKTVVCRVDGHDFALALQSDEDAEKICYAIVDNIAKKITFEMDFVPFNCYLTSYAGVSTYGTDSDDVATLIKFADIAMNHAVQKKKDKVNIYNETLEGEATKRAEIQRKIRDALENGYFYLVYQPQYTINEKKLRGFETLIRCRFPDGSFMSPGDFIPVAESTDLILDIDKCVMRRALTEFIPVLQTTLTPFTLSVNVSAKSMASSHFVDRVKMILKETGFPAKYLEIEITEYSFSESRDITFKNVMALRQLGVQIALDDFGTGYTSLEQLLKLPITLLKVDKSLIDNIEFSQTNRDFVDAVIYMGHLMSCEVISEGVENEKQLALLKDLRCDFVQGFVWGRPLSYEDAVELTHTR